MLKNKNPFEYCSTEAVFLLSLSSLSDPSVLYLVLSEDEGTGVQMDNGFCINAEGGVLHYHSFCKAVKCE